jgi:hypothetical protein
VANVAVANEIAAMASRPPVVVNARRRRILGPPDRQAGYGSPRPCSESRLNTTQSAEDVTRRPNSQRQRQRAPAADPVTVKHSSEGDESEETE